MMQSPGERRFLAPLLILLGLAALLLSAEGLRTGSIARERLPLPVLMAILAIYAGYVTLAFRPRRGWK